MRARRSAVFVAFIILGALLAVAGCGGSGGGRHALDGSAWSLIGWQAGSFEPGAFKITASFADGKISGDSAVNSYGGSYTAGPGEAFSVGDLAATEMGGTGPAMRAEQTYLRLLGEARTFKRSGDRLTLFDQHGSVALVFQAAQP